MDELTSNERVLVGFCVAAAILGIGFGYFTPNTGTNVLKDFLIFSAGCGVAYVFAAASARASTNQRIRSLCNRSVQRLGLTASHARGAARSIREHIFDQNHALALVATQLDSLAEEAEVSIGDLEELAGDKISLDPLVAGAMRTIEDAVERAIPNDQAGVKKRILSAIEAPLRKLEADVREVAIPRRGAAFACPQCGAALTADIGESIGSTVHTLCNRCASEMTVHRMADGKVLAKTIAPKLRIACPKCGGDIAVRVNPDDPGVVVRNCFKCDERIYIKTADGSIQRSESQKPLDTTYVIEGEKIVVACPRCMNEIRVAYDSDNPVRKLSCGRCTNLIRASLAQAQPGAQPDAAR